jgi:HSP20 family molecular chaperone IbpA
MLHSYFLPYIKTFAEDTINWRTEKTEKGISMSVELPGVKKEDIKIELKGDYLSLSAKKKDAKLEESWRVGSDFSKDSIDATYENGMLTIKLSYSDKDYREIKIA